MSNGPHPFRFGVSVIDRVGSAAEWHELARRVEGLGYSSLLVSDHFVEFQPPSLLALAWAAAKTETLRFGTLVLGNDYRHPAVLAKDAATLDVLSDGRLELGLGAGWLRADYDALGLSYDEPAVRVDRLAEALSVIKSAWSGEPFDFAGAHYAIQDYAAHPRPVQQPRPPLLVGGGSPRVLRLAGREADIVGIHPSTAKSDLVTDTQDERTRRKLEWVREGAGERFGELELMMQCEVAITDDRHAVASRIAARLGGSAEATLTSALTLIGSVDEVCELLQRRREAWGVSYIVLFTEAYEDFAPVVERLAGT
jgi:probable F420-dependent oxidoreductase